MADFLKGQQAKLKTGKLTGKIVRDRPVRPVRPVKIERIALASGRTKHHEYLVWSKAHAYGMNEYKLFEQDAGRWIAMMLKRAGCKDKLEYGFIGETCADGVLCTRVVIRERVHDSEVVEGVKLSVNRRANGRPSKV